MICPFLSVERVVKEVKYDANGKVTEQKETPQREMIECLKKECYMFDEGLGTCSILSLPASSESLKTLIRFTRELKDSLGSVKNATDASAAEQGRLVESMKEIQKEASDSTLSAVSKLDDEFKGLARITSDVRRGVEELVERFDGYTSRLEETTRELLEKLNESLTSQGAMLKDATGDSARILHERLDAYTERMIEASRQSSQVLSDKLESYSEKVKGVASDSSQIIHEGLETQTSRLNDATRELSRTFVDQVNNLSNAISEAVGESARKIEETFGTHSGRLIESLGGSSQATVEKLSEKLEEHCVRVTDAARETLENLREGLESHCQRVVEASDTGTKRLEDGLEAHGEKMIGVTRGISERLIQRFESFAQQVDALGGAWKEALREAAEKLSSGMDVQRKAVEAAREGNETLLSSLRESILEKAASTDDVFKGLTTRFEEMRAEIGFSSAAQIEEQKKTNTGLESLSSTLKGLSEKMASVSDKVLEANREMSEFIEVVRDAREEEVRKATLEDARAHNDRGVALYFRKSYTGALEEFEKAIGLDPTIAEAHSNMALCLTSLDKNEEAATSFKRALEIDPEMAEAYNNLGLLHFKKKDYEQALSLFQEAVKKREDYPNAYLNLGCAYKELAMYDKAVAAWEQVLKLDPGNPKAKDAIEEVRGV